MASLSILFKIRFSLIESKSEPFKYGDADDQEVNESVRALPVELSATDPI